MTSLWQRLGIVESDKTQAPTDTAPAATAATAPVMQTVTPSATLSNVPSVAESYSDVPSVLDTVAVEAQIIQIVESNPAFLAFKTLSDAADKMLSILPDEKTRFKAASATTALTLAEVQPSLESWKGIVDAEGVNFNESYVLHAESNIAMVNTQIGEAEQKLDQLTKELGELSEQKNKLMQEKVQREAELAKAKIDFNSVIQTVTNRYTSIATKLAQYLGA